MVVNIQEKYRNIHHGLQLYHTLAKPVKDRDMNMENSMIMSVIQLMSQEKQIQVQTNHLIVHSLQLIQLKLERSQQKMLIQELYLVQFYTETTLENQIMYQQKQILMHAIHQPHLVQNKLKKLENWLMRQIIIMMSHYIEQNQTQAPVEILKRLLLFEISI